MCTHTDIHICTCSHMCTCAHTQSTHRVHVLTYMHVEAHREPRHSHTQPTCSHTCIWKHAWSPCTHTYTGIHGGMHGALMLKCTRRPHKAGCLPPAGGLHPATLSARAPAARTQKQGHRGGAPMLGATCGILSRQLLVFLKSSLSSWRHLLVATSPLSRCS